MKFLFLKFPESWTGYHYFGLIVANYILKAILLRFLETNPILVIPGIATDIFGILFIGTWIAYLVKKRKKNKKYS